jgi:aminopeptidase N
MKYLKSLSFFLGLVSLNSLSAQEHKCATSRLANMQLQSSASAAATAAMDGYDIKFYHLDIAIERTNTDVSGNVLHRAEVTAPSLSQYVFELHPNFIIDSIHVNQQLSSSSRTGNEIFVTLNTPASQGDQLEVRIWYRGTAPNSGSAAIGNGLSSASSQSWGNRVTWSLSQPYAAYEWWPCKQVLTDKADSSWVFITTDSTNMAGANGLLTQVTTLGNKKRYEWKSSYPIAYYLISVSVARYIDYSIYANPAGSPNPVLIQNFIYDNPQTLPNFQADIDETKDMMEEMALLFGPYPFDREKYGHCMAPFSGGMEHQTMTTQGFFVFELTAHEIGHQWFGDHVTCATWSDIWVNEGFASYSEYLALEKLHPTDAAPHMFDVHSNIMSQPGGSVWFTDTTQVSRIFNSRLTYNKGSAILHTLRFEVNNDSLFFLSLRNFLSQYGNSNATALQFKQVIENTTGMNFTTFFNQWFYGEGFPTFTVKWFHKDDQLYLQNSQTVSMPSVTPLFDTPVEFRLNRGAGQDTLIRLQLNQASQVYALPVGGTINSVTLDPRNWLINQSGGVTKDSSIMQLVALEGKLNGLQQMVDFGANPISEGLQFTVISGEGKGVLSLVDISGATVARIAVENGKAYLPVQHLNAGSYIAIFTDSNGISIHNKMLIMN